MKKLLIALASAGVVLGAGSVSAQPYHNNWDHRADRDWHDRDHGWHARDWHDHDRGWRLGWWGHHRPYYGNGYAYGREVCSWRYGERVCWYQY